MSMVSAYIKKIDLTVDREWEKLPEATREHVADYGFRQLVADSHASVKREDYAEGTAGDEAFGVDVKLAVDARLAQMDTGNFTRATKSDPATARIRAAIKEAGVDLAKVDPAKLVAFLKRQAESGRAA